MKWRFPILLLPLLTVSVTAFADEIHSDTNFRPDTWFIALATAIIVLLERLPGWRIKRRTL